MRFYLNRTGQNEGPLEEAAIAAMVQRGEVPPTAYICPEGGSAWQPVSSHPAFAPKPAAPSPFAQTALAAPAAPAPAMPAGKPIAATMAMDSAMIQAAAAASSAGLSPSPVAGQRPPSGGFGPPASGFSPAPAQFTPPPGAAPMAAPPEQKKNNMPLILGGGCGALFLLFLCGLCGVWAINQ